VIRYREIQPSAQLMPFVANFWILEHDGVDGTHQRVVPDGHCELILNWDHPFESLHAGRWQRQPRHFLAGQIDGPVLLRPSGNARMLGVRFRPHGAAWLLGQSGRELSGRFTPAEDLSPALSSRLKDALEADDPVAAVETVLLSAEKVSGDGDVLVAEAVRRIHLEKGSMDLGALARELGLSIRQLERRFLFNVGLPPKLFCRIERFNNVFHALSKPSRNWVETAVACGYYDQAHLIRDCKSLSGQTPAILLAEDADLARHFYARSVMSRLSNTDTLQSV
jgi:AraC-like DNA-binding protein